VKHQKALKARKTLINSVIFVIVLIAFNLSAMSCATAGSRFSPAEIDIKAKATPQGICLTFENIPPETKRIFVYFSYFNGIDEISLTPMGYVSSFSDLRDSSLEQLKQTGMVILPVEQKGQIYSIGIIIQNEHYEDIAKWIHLDCVADNGKYSEII